MKFRLIYLFLFFSITSFAVPTDNGDLLFNNKQYSKARAVYEGLLKKRPNDALYNYKYARCCYELKDFEDAIIHFEMSGSKFPLRDLYLGELYFNTYRFDQSIMAYQTYIATLKPDDKKIPEYEAVENMTKDGLTSYVEVGPGKVLQGLIKKINKDAEAISA